MQGTTISSRQKAILDFIISELKNRGSSPSIHEISEHIGVTSTSTVHYHLAELEKKGQIFRDSKKSRSIRPAKWKFKTAAPEDAADVVEVPVIGEIAAGSPIFAYEYYHETIKIARSLISNSEAFILKVKGESMIEDLIDDGDMVLVKKQNYASNGDIIVALVDEDKATLKRFYLENGRFKLQPANKKLAPFYVDHLTILGRVISVIRPMERKAAILAD